MEIYGLRDPNTNEINGSQIVDVCQMCQLNISEKKSSYKNQQVLMAGVRDYALDKYLPKMIDGGYNVVVYVQEKTAIGIVRVFDAVYSPGTFLSSEDNTSQITNNIMCFIQIHCISVLLCAATAFVNISSSSGLHINLFGGLLFIPCEGADSGLVISLAGGATVLSFGLLGKVP